MRGRAMDVRRVHNPEVVGSNPTPATCPGRQKLVKRTGYKNAFIGAARQLKLGSSRKQESDISVSLFCYIVASFFPLVSDFY